jgi:hypothetical protein
MLLLFYVHIIIVYHLFQLSLIYLHSTSTDYVKLHIIVLTNIFFSCLCIFLHSKSCRGTKVRLPWCCIIPERKICHHLPQSRCHFESVPG